MVRIQFYRTQCIGCYYCNEVAPQRWKMDEEDGLATLVDAEDNGHCHQLITTDDEYNEQLEVEYNCPSGAIRVEPV